MVLAFLLSPGTNNMVFNLSTAVFGGTSYVLTISCAFFAGRQLLLNEVLLCSTFIFHGSSLQAQSLHQSTLTLGGISSSPTDENIIDMVIIPNLYLQTSSLL